MTEYEICSEIRYKLRYYMWMITDADQRQIFHEIFIKQSAYRRHDAKAVTALPITTLSSEMIIDIFAINWNGDGEG